MSLFSLIEICCFGAEESSKPNVILVQEDDDSFQSSSFPSDKKAQDALRIKHEKSILSSPLEPDDALQFVCKAHPKTTDDENFLKLVFRDHYFFEDLNEAELNEIVYGMEMIEAVAGQEVDTEFMYVVQVGRLSYCCGETEGETSTKVSEGELFCEIDLMYGAKGNKVIVAEVRSILWRLHNFSYRSVLAKHALKNDGDIRTRLRKVELFKDLSEQTINKFADSLTRVHYEAGDRIIAKGETGEIFHIIEQGKVRVHDIGIGDSRVVDQIMGNGDAFGERALITGELRVANVTAVSNVTTLVMDRATFNESIGELRDLMDFNDRLHTIKGLSIFAESDLTQIEFERLAEKICEVCYKKGTKLVQIGSPYPQNIWMFRKGELIVYGTKSDTIHKMQGGDYFGDKSILNSLEHISSHDATCETNVTAYLLTRDDIESVVVDVSRLGKTSGFIKHKQREKMSMNDLKKHRVLGEGGFGTVWLCTSKKDNTAYALKIISKRKVLEEKQERSVLREKELLSMLQHPFILGMENSFTDETNCYLVTPVIQGGTLFSYLAKMTKGGRLLPKSHVVFYAASIIEGLGHFHHRFIAYRDLKLENLMVGADGYIKIVDLGFAKIILNKSYTFCGTPGYLAPEVIFGRGHGHAVDYWSYGVLLYELLFGVSPFNKYGETIMQLFKRILTVKYEFPLSTDKNGENLVKRLLVRRAADRIGNLKNGYLDIRNHSFLMGVDTKKLLKKEITPPWIPNVTDKFDSQNFDDSSKFENGNISDTPLTIAQQAAFAKF